METGAAVAGGLGFERVYGGSRGWRGWSGGLAALLVLLAAGCRTTEPAAPLVAASIQAAIDEAPEAGGPVPLQAGIYEIDKPIVLRSGIGIGGLGAGTVLRAADGFAGPLITAEPGASGMMISGLSLVGVRPGSGEPPTRAIELKGVLGVKILSVSIRGFGGEAVSLEECGTVELVNLEIAECASKPGTAAIGIRGSNDCLVMKNRVSDCPQGGVAIHGGRGNIVGGNELSNIERGTGILFANSADSLAINNIVRSAAIEVAGDPDAAGIAALGEGATGKLLFGNAIINTGGPGILVRGGSQTKLVGNIVRRGNQMDTPGSGGICVHGVKSPLLQTNWSVGNHGHGVVIADSPGASLVGNTAPENRDGGLLLGTGNEDAFLSLNRESAPQQ